MHNRKMPRVLLVLDDYRETVSAETTLRKIGFDVVGLNSDMGVGVQMLSFRPEVMVASGFGTRVRGLQIGKSLREGKLSPTKLALVFPKNKKPDPQDLMSAQIDAIIESPYSMERLIEVLAKLMELEPQGLLDKYSRLRYQGEREAPIHVRSQSQMPGPDKAQSGESAFVDPARAERYQKFIQGKSLPGPNQFDRSLARSRFRALRKDWSQDLLDKVNEARAAFTRALFRKKD